MNINYNSKPAKLYYLYTSDGCIYERMTSKPVGGGVKYYYPYFEQNIYIKDDKGELKCIATTNDVKLKSWKTYERISEHPYVKETTIDLTTLSLFDADGKAIALTTLFPTADELLATSLPHVISTSMINVGGLRYSKNDTYMWFDYLIEDGDKYSNKKFTIRSNSGYTSYDNYLFNLIASDKTKGSKSLTDQQLLAAIADSKYVGFCSGDSSITKAAIGAFGTMFQTKVKNLLKVYAEQEIAAQERATGVKATVTASTFVKD